MTRYGLMVLLLASSGWVLGAEGGAKKNDKAAKKQATHDRTVQASFNLADKNGDKKLSREEFKASQWNLPNPDEVFRKADKNNDGALSLSEFEAAWPKKDAKGGNKGGNKGGKKGGKKGR